MNSERIVKWFEQLTTTSLDEIDNIYAQDIFFKDPFNELLGIEKVKVLFVHMFEKLEEPEFQIIDVVENEDQIFMSWDFNFKLSSKRFLIHGSSHLKIINNRVSYHRDYWDVGEEVLAKIPYVKYIYNKFSNKLSVE